MALHFHPLQVKRVTPDAAGAAAVTLQVPEDLVPTFDFRPGQFLTLRAHIAGEDVRRNYSICSSHQRFTSAREIEVGIKPVEGGVFSNWAVKSLQPGASIDVMPPDGRFSPRVQDARHRVGFAAGSGITPILSIIASTLASDPRSSFTLVYCNQRVNSIMFHEALQDLKDRYPSRLTLVHLLSRQPQEVALLHGRMDEAKVTELLNTIVPAASIDEAFVCGPEGMITAVEAALHKANVPADRIHTERFSSPGAPASAHAPVVRKERMQKDLGFQLEVILDGKTHQMSLAAEDHVLDAALDAGLDLPYSCKGGVCCTCRARVIEGEVTMDKNYTLEQDEMDRGFVLTCQSRPVSRRVVVSYDDR